MKTKQRGFIVPLLIVIIALLLAGGGAYVYMQQKQANQSTTVVSQDIISKIILSGRALSSEEKVVLEDYYNNLIKYGELDAQQIYKNVKKEYQDSHSIFYCTLKYYDATKVLVGCDFMKSGPFLHLVNRNNWKDIGENNEQLDFFHGYAESTEYVITVNDNGIFYYKAGDSDIHFISGSKLAGEETYIKSFGKVDEYTITFDEPTRTLMATVYKPSGGIANSEVRVVKFVLP